MRIFLPDRENPEAAADPGWVYYDRSEVINSRESRRDREVAKMILAEIYHN